MGREASTTRFDGPSGAVADLEKAHQTAGFAAAGKRFSFTAQRREIRARVVNRYQSRLARQVIGVRRNRQIVEIRVAAARLHGRHECQ